MLRLNRFGRRTRLTVLALSAVVLLAFCQCGDDVVTDSGSARDTGVDSSADTGMDARLDSALADTGGTDAAGDADAGPPWVGPYPDAEWVGLPGLPAGCVIQRAERREAVLEPTWIPCDVGIEGCTMLPPPPEGLERRFTRRVGDHDGTRGIFVYRDLPSASDQPIVTVLASTVGPPIAAYRMPPLSSEVLCLLASVGIGPSTAAFTTETLTPDLTVRFYFASHEAIGALEEPAHVLTERELLGPSILQTLAVSDTTVVSDIQPSGQVAIMTVDDIRIISPRELSRSPQGVMVSGDNAYWENGSVDVQMMHATLTTGPTVLIDRLPGEVLSSSAHRSMLAWYEAYDQDPVTLRFDRLELWTAAAVSRSEDLEPRLVATQMTRGLGRVLDGYYCFTRRVDLQRYFQLFDLASGRLRELPMPTGWVPAGGFLFLGDGEVGVGVASPEGETLWRIPLASIPYVD